MARQRPALHPTRLLPWLLAALAHSLPAAAADTPAVDLQRLTAPPGFTISLASAAVPGARQLALAANGVLFVGSMRPGAVYALTDPDGDGVYGAPLVVAEGLQLPSGVAVRNGDLYVGAISTILRFPGAAALAAAGATEFPREVVTDSLPDDRHHGWKYLRFAPDGRLLVPVGAPCNICNEALPYAALLSMDVADGTTTVLAEGIRNTVGLAVHPATGEVWFSDNGRDMLGDDVPPEEINRISATGQHFGYPFWHAGDIPDPEFNSAAPERHFTAPALKIQAHSAALGLTFHQGAGMPEHKGALFIAEHGSWNRSSKVGYQVSVASLDASGTRITGHQPFITGWLQGEEAWGRPNDVLVAADGSLLVSDDRAGVIYRVRRQP